MQYALWNCGIDINLKTYHCKFSSNSNNNYYQFFREEIQYRQEMQIYAICNYFAITKLMNLILQQYPLNSNTYYTCYARHLNMAMKSAYRKLIALSQILQRVSDDTIDDETPMDTQMAETKAAIKNNEEELQRFIIRETFQLLVSVDGVAKLKPALYPSNAPTSILNANDLNRRYATCCDGPFIPRILSDQMDSYMYDCFKRDFMHLIERLRR
ncbi:unnamed protein product, partial [Rotaria sordida]